MVNAPALELEVSWAQKAGVKRVVTTDEARVMVGAKSWYLPYHVCLSDMLFGEELYDTRRVFLQLPPPRPNPFIKGKDAGIVTPAMARADVVGTQEITDADGETGDGAPVAVAAVHPRHARGARGGGEAWHRPLQPPKVEQPCRPATRSSEAEKLAMPEHKAGKLVRVPRRQSRRPGTLRRGCPACNAGRCRSLRPWARCGRRSCGAPAGRSCTSSSC